MISSYFRILTPADLQVMVAERPGETRVGQRVAVVTDGQSVESALQSRDVRFVLLGIPEDIGVRANGGIGGAHTAWWSALKAFLNTQSTRVFDGSSVLVLGHFDFSAWMEASLTENTPQLRERVAAVDDEVYPLIQTIVAQGKIPVVVGGGHNNAYPLLKGASLALGAPINCINLDAHSDYRILEGRHSGNGFRYARSEGYLSCYAMIGLHEAYNSQSVIGDIGADPDLNYTLFEDIILSEEPDLEEAVDQALRHTQTGPTGIELDLDCIAGVLSSAVTPVGITTGDARRYLHCCAEAANIAYVHIAEGAAELRDGRSDPGTGKLIAYLLRDFMRSFTGAGR